MAISLDSLKVGMLVRISPPVGKTVTTWSRADKRENIGDLNDGEVYKVHKIDYALGMVELELVGDDTWPDSLHPLSWAGVWVEARFLSVPGITPLPVPVPVPEDGTIKALAAKVGQVLLDWSKIK